MFAPVDVLVVVPSDQSNASAAVSSQTATASTTSSNHNDAVWIRVSLLDRGVEPDDPSVLPQVSEPSKAVMVILMKHFVPLRYRCSRCIQVGFERKWVAVLMFVLLIFMFASA